MNWTVDDSDMAIFRVPTDSPESDGTLPWDHTDVMVVRLSAGDCTGIGWSYASAATAKLTSDTLLPAIHGSDALDIESAWQEMNRRLRNAGRVGAGMMAVSAVDIAMWDLKARLLGVSLLNLLGACRPAVELYGSGGFTSYNDRRLTDQLGGWASEGFRHVKMKIGRDPADDARRVATARKAIGEHVELFVDANGAYSRKQALAMAERLTDECDIKWFEEPVSSDDLDGLRLIRDRAPAGLDIAAGEYGDTPSYFRTMLSAGAVDCLQADATRCGGYTGFRKVAALCEAFHIPLSAHCAPQLHAHVCCATPLLRHLEYFHDHNLIDRLLFDGSIDPVHGTLIPDRSRPGHGMSLRGADADRYRIS